MEEVSIGGYCFVDADEERARLVYEALEGLELKLAFEGPKPTVTHKSYTINKVRKDDGNVVIRPDINEVYINETVREDNPCIITSVSRGGVKLLRDTSYEIKQGTLLVRITECPRPEPSPWGLATESLTDIDPEGLQMLLRHTYELMDKVLAKYPISVDEGFILSVECQTSANKPYSLKVSPQARRGHSQSKAKISDWSWKYIQHAAGKIVNGEQQKMLLFLREEGKQPINIILERYGKAYEEPESIIEMPVREPTTTLPPPKPRTSEELAAIIRTVGETAPPVVRVVERKVVPDGDLSDKLGPPPYEHPREVEVEERERDGFDSARISEIEMKTDEKAAAKKEKEEIKKGTTLEVHVPPPGKGVPKLKSELEMIHEEVTLKITPEPTEPKEDLKKTKRGGFARDVDLKKKK